MKRSLCTATAAALLLATVATHATESAQRRQPASASAPSAAPRVQAGTAASQAPSGAVPATTMSAATAADMADAEVRKVDKAAGTVTLRHGEIKNLKMPGMTMVFKVKDRAALDKLAVGDKIKFRAERQGGSFVVTDFQTPAK